MTQVFEDRKILINAISAVHKDTIVGAGAVANILAKIKKDEGQFLSICQDKPNLVEYSQSNTKLTNRVSTSLSRYVRRQLRVDYDSFTDRALESFSTSVTSNILKKKKAFSSIIKILRCEDILKFYVEAERKTPSCMTGAHNTEKIRMYAENPDKVCLVTANNIGRALLWTADDGAKLLDWVYPSRTPHAQIILDWAAWRKYPAISDYNHLNPIKPMKVTMKTTASYPRLDTLYYVILDEKNKTAILHNNRVAGVNCQMNATNGTFYRI